MDNMAQKIVEMADQLNVMATDITITSTASSIAPQSFFITAITVLVLAAFLGYYVVWNVTPTLHSPLMSVTNAISSIIIIGAIIATQKTETWWGFFAIIFASINIFGGFLVTQRMLDMFKDKKTKNTKKRSSKSSHHTNKSACVTCSKLNVFLRKNAYGARSSVKHFIKKEEKQLEKILHRTKRKRKKYTHVKGGKK